MAKKWVVSVGAGRWQVGAIKRLRSEGFFVLALDGDHWAPGFKFSNEKLIVNISIVEAVKESVINFFSTRQKPVAIVCSACEVGVMASACLRELFCLPGIKMCLAQKLVNKGLQRSAWLELNSPNFYIHNKNDILRLDFPNLKTEKIVVKPLDSSGSRGVYILPRSELTNTIVLQSIEFSRLGAVIIEEFISGIEFTVESVCIEGVNYIVMISEKGKVQNGSGTVANVLYTYAPSNDELDQLKELLNKAHSFLGYNDGVCHTEVIRDNNGEFWLIETAGRGAGFGVSEFFVNKAVGFDYFQAALNFDLGRNVLPPEHFKAPPPFFAIRYIESQKGIFVGINSNSGVDIHTIIKTGQIIDDAKTDADRVGYFIIKDNNREALDSEINRILQATSVLVKPL